MKKSSEMQLFLSEQLPKRIPSIEKLRQMVYKEYPDIVEVVNKNIISFKKDNITLFSFGSQKQTMCFYFSKAMMLKHKSKLNVKGLSLGKGTIRFTNIDKIPLSVFEEILKDAAEFPFEFSKRGDSTR